MISLLYGTFTFPQSLRAWSISPLEKATSADDLTFPTDCSASCDWEIVTSAHVKTKRARNAKLTMPLHAILNKPDNFKPPSDCNSSTSMQIHAFRWFESQLPLQMNTITVRSDEQYLSRSILPRIGNLNYVSTKNFWESFLYEIWNKNEKGV